MSDFITAMNEPAKATAAAAGVVTVEAVIELGNVVQAFGSIIITVLTLAWWVRIWWKSMKDGGNLPGRGGDE